LLRKGIGNPEADPLPGYFNIGVLHTSCDGRPGHATYAPCTIQDLASRNYQYWALGHVHEYEELSRDPWIVFPGNLQGRNVRECGRKGAVIVDVEDGHVTTARRVIVDCARWSEVLVDLGGIDDETALLRAIEETILPAAQDAEGRLLALRVRLEGRTPLHRRLKADPRSFADEVQAAAHRCHEDVWLERLRIDTKEADIRAPGHNDSAASLDLGAILEGLEHDPNLRAAASQLLASIAGKLPGGMVTGETPLPDNLDELLGDAQALVLGRTMRQQED
jgi:exonuclease SbcD